MLTMPVPKRSVLVVCAREWESAMPAPDCAQDTPSKPRRSISQATSSASRYRPGTETSVSVNWIGCGMVGLLLAHHGRREGSDESVILSGAKDLVLGSMRQPNSEILRSAQDDRMGR